MIQFNLLPDVKLEFMRTQRLKRLVIAVAALVSGLSLVLFVVLFIIVRVVQKTQITNLNKDVKAKTSEISKKDDINKILTVQNQLDSLAGLHEQRPVATRLFTFIKQFTPQSATITKLSVAFDANHIEINGNADRLETVNKFVDTLKFTTFTTAENTEEADAFQTVVLNTFNVDNKTGVSFNVSFDYDPILFDGKQEVTLLVPKDKITTRSTTELPLFAVPLKTDTTEEQQ